MTPYFFVQVKTTREGYTMRTNHLKVRVALRNLKQLATYPAPTYIVGIDEVGEKGYIISAGKRWKKGIASLPTSYPVNEVTQKLLWQEVKDYWVINRRSQAKSRFEI